MYGSGGDKGYVSQDGIKGYLSKDKVSFSGFEADMSFGAIDSVYDGLFNDFPCSGILGLAYDTVSIDQYPTFIESIDTADKSFGFFLNNDIEGSYMTIPGMETEGLTKIATHDVIEMSQWNLNLTSLTGPNGK